MFEKYCFKNNSILILLLFVFNIAIVHAQVSNNQSEEPIYGEFDIDETPLFPGGISDYLDFINNNMKYR